ncbi:hypothetical protein EVAR_61829_1 [Eumeta japonica]|uniref:Uncharacterized protein n=1 Tax=Eumeta variegata TaxID=151549 RepID=A0A4C1YX51_EUMVA|nr:hypothetical protein EVAR_61829_1 [Eumeta japonica]
MKSAVRDAGAVARTCPACRRARTPTATPPINILGSFNKRATRAIDGASRRAPPALVYTTRQTNIRGTRDLVFTAARGHPAEELAVRS